MEKTLGKLDPRAPGLYSHACSISTEAKFWLPVDGLSQSLHFPHWSEHCTFLVWGVRSTRRFVSAKSTRTLLKQQSCSSKFNIIVILQNVSCSLPHWNLQPPALKLLCFKYNFWRSFAPQTRVSWRVLLCFCFLTI